MKLTILGTGNAAVTECYNTCFLLTEGSDHLLVDGGGGNGIFRQLKAAGVRMAVFSNKADEFARAVVARYFDADLFEVVRGALPDVPTKPAPEGTRALMARLGVEADGSVLYVGDSNVDVETAHNAGLPCCGVLWGFRTREELTEAGAEYLAEDTQGLEKVVLG